MQKLMQLVAEHMDQPMPQVPQRRLLERVGRNAAAALQQALALLSFIGESATVAMGLFAHPRRMRWRTVLRNIQIGDSEALPIIGLTSLLLGVVVAYQGADRLRHYGANSTASLCVLSRTLG